MPTSSGVGEIPQGSGTPGKNSLSEWEMAKIQWKIQNPMQWRGIGGRILSAAPEEVPALIPLYHSSSARNEMLPKDNSMDAVVIQNGGDQLQPEVQENDRKRKLSSYNPSPKFFLSFKDSDDDDDTGSSPFGNLNQTSGSKKGNEEQAFTFEEFGSLQASKSEILCCHFSSEGRRLAIGGQDKRPLIWDMETLDFFRAEDGHSQLISDVRFKPHSNIFATSSYDKTVQIWDASKPSKALTELQGHEKKVMSLDFHPRKTELLVSCDSSDEIRLWNINKCFCARVSKGATRQVRFLPRSGISLAAASGNCINLIDVETDNLQFRFEGHAKEVRSICWDASGKYIASICEDSARLWSVLAGKWIHELHSNGKNFQSCTFHPKYLHLLVIGGYQGIQLWNPAEGPKTVTVPAHDGLVTALADSPDTNIMVSASHDKYVKLWR